MFFLFLYERMFFFPSFVRKIVTSTICRQIFRFGTSTKTPPTAMGFSLRSYGFCWGVERAVAMAYEVGKTGKRGRLKVAFPFFWGLVFHGIFRVYPKRYIAFLVGFLKKFEVRREHVGVQIDRFRKRMWGLSSTFSKRCMVLLGFLWFGVVFFSPILLQ